MRIPTTIPPLAERIADYFGADEIADADAPPAQAQTFHTVRGWETPVEPITDLSVDRLRVLRANGVLTITVKVGNRYADFPLTEILSEGRPLLGGTII